MRPLLTFGVALGLAWCARPAQAQERAEALFERGVSAFLAGRFEEGCPLIEKSHALDPLPGVLFTLAECQFGWGKAKTAADNYGRFLDVVGRLPPAEAGKHAERAAVAIRKRAQAAQRIASVTLRVRGQWVPGTRVTLGSKDVTLLVVNYDNERDLKKTLKVRAQSTLLVFKGNRETARQGGETAPDKLKAALLTAR